MNNRRGRLRESKRMSEIQGYKETIAFLEESLVDLELNLEDASYTKLGDAGSQFSREGLRKICATALIQWLSNPIVKQAVGIQTRYVFGQGVTVKAKHPEIDAALQAFWKNPKNKACLTSHQARMMKETELQIASNLFFAFVVNPATGRVIVRSIPFDEIDDVITNPEDALDPWFYRRSWYETDLSGRSIKREVYYPDFRHDPEAGDRPTGEIAENVYIYHVKTNCLSGMKFGVSEIFASSQWAKSYGEFLKDWATITKALSRFAWKITTKGGAKSVQAVKRALVTKIGGEDASRGEQGVGGMWVEGEGNELSPMKTSGATVKMEDGRRLLLMAAAGFGIFEHYFGDGGNANLATATAMERPMELMFIDRQSLWRDILGDIGDFVIKQAVKAKGGRLRNLGTITLDEDDNEAIEWKTDADGREIDGSIDVTFPSILEKDAEKRINALIKAITLDGKSPAETIDFVSAVRMLLVALGEENIEEYLSKRFPEGEAEWPKLETAKAIANGENPLQDDDEDPEKPVMESRAERVMISTMEDLREGLAKLLESGNE